MNRLFGILFLVAVLLGQDVVLSVPVKGRTELRVLDAEANLRFSSIRQSREQPPSSSEEQSDSQDAEEDETLAIKDGDRFFFTHGGGGSGDESANDMERRIGIVQSVEPLDY
ncbi:hypothetical protein NDN08_007299 [Rhodosorus marinus]|uniref:Uncharacterized protein n=1 Tax=Rhodosorus marinus TaxID=101924 RepID=A0AAV8UIV0_9RHOD|nr:hypothetical protein NDN08_007299 [Rhodosorus marinus]